MQHLPSGRIQWTPAPAEHFTGSVWFGPLVEETASDRRSAGPPINALAVSFAPGARTDWHHHPDGQMLFVTGGAGLVGAEDGTTIEITAGDVVHAPPGQRHWHGAQPASPMTHLSLTTGGETVWDAAKVTDDEYGAR